ncbi:hypothetical protein HBH53_243200 [Parastagonospora nodorum]|nr:hypothetical protein HBH53_243200 [Parastagonospora nodorum]KAH3959059.1 hypothetical protein HBH51_203850 [Parastagonospora nodorum]KAH5750099.1 hypothetical protein HBI97_243070 [Parastagonospora nodorum]KAH5783167.1 hypothetical protein HBI96_243470 [Parastagonospora nodorum]KAH5796447.1 hypothetical protein HBI94_243200 [Parastagonospora nodorum]
MSLYQYQALEHWDSFRLVILHPASRSTAPIRCSLQHVRSTELPKYEAISYTWGNTNLLHSLHMGGNGNFLKVTTNCFHALRHLRRADSDRALWIDAICINQMDLDERGHQVKTMNMIYEMASTVVIYLGEETKGSRILFKELAKAKVELSKTGKCNRQPPDDVIISELEVLIQRPWFQRIWVLQEVSGNDQIVVMCGSARTSLEALDACLFGYQDIRVIEDILPLPIRLWGRTRSKVAEYPDAPIHLWHCLLLSRKYLATDPRDKIFALRSLLQKERRDSMDHLIDYAATTEQTFLKTALFLLPEIGLHLLTANRHPHNMRMPSWIPDFSQTSPLDSWSPYKKIGNVPASFRVVTQPCIGEARPKLHIRGLRYTAIRKSSRTWRFEDIKDAEHQMHIFYNSLPSLSMIINESVDECTEYGSYHCDTEILQALISQAWNDVRAFGSDLQRGSGGDFARDPRTASSFPQEFHEGLADSRIILTDTYELAIVPAAACIGDTICLFLHGQSPCLLRQQDKNCWTMISGDCYIFRRPGRQPMAEFPYQEFCMERAADMETFEIC